MDILKSIDPSGVLSRNIRRVAEAVAEDAEATADATEALYILEPLPF